jgi:hypothetical protein
MTTPVAFDKVIEFIQSNFTFTLLDDKSPVIRRDNRFSRTYRYVIDDFHQLWISEDPFPSINGLSVNMAMFYPRAGYGDADMLWKFIRTTDVIQPFITKHGPECECN